MKIDMSVSFKTEHLNREGLTAVLNEAINVVNAIGASFGNDGDLLRELQDRLAHGYYHLAVLGQFKRGKSTFLNALLGEHILPTSVVPLTAIPTFIRHNAALSVTVSFCEKPSEKTFSLNSLQEITEVLSRFVTEESNPKNQLGVSEVEVFCPGDILSGGIVFIDTPGIGSTFRHNTEATLNFLPQCDAALFMVSADPPITEVEVTFLKEVRQKVRRLFFVLNKVDYLDDKERQMALAFFQNVLREQAGFDPVPEIFCVSAKQGMSAKEKCDDALWKQSGMESVILDIERFCLHEKTEALFKTISQKAANVLSQVRMRLRLMVRSLELPVEDLEKRLDLFTEKVKEIEKERTTAKDILTGDHKRLHEQLEDMTADLKKRARDYLKNTLTEKAYQKDGQHIDENALQDILAEIIPGYFEHEFGRITRMFEEKRNRIFENHQRRVDGLMDFVRKTAAELFEIPYAPRGDFAPLKIVLKPYWVTHKWHSSLKLIPEEFMDKLYSRPKRHERILKRLITQIDNLLVPNVENVRWSLFQTIDREFIAFSGVLERQFEDSVSLTQGAVKSVLDKRKEHVEETAEDMKFFQSYLEKVESVLAKITVDGKNL